MFVERARPIAAIACSVFVLLGVNSEARAQPAPDYATLVAAPDRSDADRQADKRRDPVPFLSFAAVRPGMKVLDMGAGGGYSTKLIARAVAPNGVVYSQNPPDLPERPKTAFDARSKTPAMKDVVVDIRPFDDPVPPDVHDFDLVTFLFFYHDTTYMNVDRAEMNRKLFAALKPGGFLLIADHSALTGQGVSVGKTLHRIEESTLRQEVEAAGFRLVAEGNFGGTQMIRTTSQVINRRCRWTISCLSFRSQIEPRKPSGASRASRGKLANCSLRSTGGLPKASTRST
jgi:predicted methyltransferase